MNKYFIIILAFLFLTGIVSAVESAVIKTSINVEFIPENNNITGVLRIKGEGIDWIKTINVTQPFTANNLELLFVRDLGNFTEVQSLLETCKTSLNYSALWRDCIENKSLINLQALQCQVNYDNCKKDVGFEANYTTCKENIIKKDAEISNKEIEKQQGISSAETKLEQQTSLRNWLVIIALVGWGIAGFYLSKKIRNPPESIKKERPVDIPF